MIRANNRWLIVGILTTGLSLPNRAEAGDTFNALPGIVHVPTTGTTANPGFAAAMSAGYGFTGSVLDEGDSHHRLLGSLAASFTPNEWLSMSLQLDGRYDWHTGVTEKGGGATGDPRLFLRAGRDLSGGFKIGAQAGLWAPGRKVPSFVPGALSPEVALLGTYASPDSAVTLSTLLGFRLDNSLQASPTEVDQLARSDRFALGASDANAMLFGLGASVAVSPGLEALGEWTWDVRVPSNGAPLLSSPMRIDAGARWSPAANGPLQLLFIAEVSPSERVSQLPGSPIVAAEPTAKLLFGLTYRPKPAETPAVAPVVVPAAPQPPPPAPEPTVEAPPAEEALPVAQIRGTVHSFSGKAIAARVRVEPLGKEIAVGQTGEFQLDVPPGEYEVVISAPGFRTQRRHVKVEEQGVVLINVDLLSQ